MLKIKPFQLPECFTFKQNTMKKFIVMYHAPIAMMEQAASTSPEDRNKSMEEWMKWAANCGDKLVDMGTPLDGGVSLNPCARTSGATIR